MLQLQELVDTLNRQKASKVDVVLDSRHLRVVSADDGFRLVPDHAQAQEWLPKEGVAVTRHCLPQVCERGKPGFPHKFIKELHGAGFGDKAADLMTELLRAEPQRNLVRMLDGKARAFLSNKYLVLDNHDIAFACLDVARQFDGEVLACDLSETRMRIQFTSRKVWDTVNVATQEAKLGALSNHHWLNRVDRGKGFGFDMPGGPGTVRPLITLSNSETGHGGYNVSVGLLQDVCVNGAIIEKVAQRVHLGSALAEGLFRPETVATSAKAIAMQAQDAVRAAFQPDGFKRILALVEGAQAEAVKAPTAAVNNVVAVFELPIERKEAILEYFLKDYGGADAYGLAQAVARAAQDTEDGDEAEAFQNAAGQIIAKPATIRRASKKEKVAELVPAGVN